MSILLTAGNLKSEFEVASNAIKFMPNFTKICPMIPELKHAERQIDMTSPTCIHFMHTVQRMHTRKNVNKECSVTVTKRKCSYVLDHDGNDGSRTPNTRFILQTTVHE
jgi:hypothetical protein